MKGKRNTPESFWARTKVVGACLEWQGYCKPNGYGFIRWNGPHYAHRIAAWLSGLIDDPKGNRYGFDGTHVLHRCDNKRCCRPDHLFIGTQADNLKDASIKKRMKGAPKLSDKETQEIRKKWNELDITQQELASQYQVSQSLISMIVNQVIRR